MIAASAGAVLLGGNFVRADAAPIEGGGHDSLLTLAGKKPLIRRSFRPPNVETPLADLRQPFTRNDVFFVRYHLSAIPQRETLSSRVCMPPALSHRVAERIALN